MPIPTVIMRFRLKYKPDNFCLNVSVGRTIENQYYYRSDHYHFVKNNIPSIFFFSGTHVDYHEPTDTAEKILYNLFKKRTKLIFHTAWDLANRDKKITLNK